MTLFNFEQQQQTENFASLFNPVRIERVFVQSDEYVQGEDFAIYLPVKFDMLSLVFNKFEHFKKFSEQEWIESGYKMPLEQTFANTQNFILSIPEQYLYSLATENIEPTPYGTFVLDFINNQNRVSIEIGKEQLGFFTKFVKKEDMKSDGIIFNGNEVPKEVFAAFEEMVS